LSLRCDAGSGLWRGGLAQKTAAAFCTQPETVATDCEDVAVVLVEQPVEDGGGNDGAPLANGAVRSDHHRAFLITSADEPEELMSSARSERQIAKLADN